MYSGIGRVKAYINHSRIQFSDPLGDIAINQCRIRKQFEREAPLSRMRCYLKEVRPTKYLTASKGRKQHATVCQLV
jgi:hypothetical protein